MQTAKTNTRPGHKILILLIMSTWLAYSGALLCWWAYVIPADDVCFAPRN